jgi:hypothetical protein
MTMQTETHPQPTIQEPQLTDDALARSRALLSDRGIDPGWVLGKGELGEDVTVAGFHVILGMVAASEKAGQSPTHALARLALAAELPSEIADTLFLAYNQQSAEEAGHGDKVFGNAYYAMGGRAATSELSAFGNSGGEFLQPGDDAKQNKKRLGGMAAVLGGIEIVALQRAFPLIVSLCEHWDHPIARDLLAQIRDVVRPEESRHVLIWRYVFHQLIAPKGEPVIDAYMAATNSGRRGLGAPELEREAFMRLLGTGSPTARQLLGKERSALI